MDEIVNYIVINKIKCYFISPHQDDAIFSAGGLISYLSNKTEVKVINVFNGIGKPPYTLSGNVFVKRSGCKSVKDLYDKRHLEDASVFKEMGVDMINLNFDDALWRKKPIIKTHERIIGKVLPEILHIYPIYRTSIAHGQIKKSDESNLGKIEKALRKNIKGKNVFVFCSASIGGHVDHKIVRNICESSFKNLYLWSDYPYNIRLGNYKNYKSISENDYFEFKYGQPKRFEMIKIKFGYKYEIKLTYQDIKNKWGVFHNKNSIVLNPRLIYVSKACIDYVITHELNHIKYRNHDKKFFESLDKIVPKWKKIKDKLEEQGAQITH